MLEPRPMKQTPSGPDPRTARTAKAPRKVSARFLENAALYYLKRHASTQAQLKRVLLRRVNRSLRFHGGDRLEALSWVDTLVARLVQSGLLSDEAYAETKAHALRNSGRSARVITQKLKMKGVAPDVVTRTLAHATAELSEEEAARIWARKKRLGPFRREASTRKNQRQRDLAAMARAGFSFQTAQKTLDEDAG